MQICKYKYQNDTSYSLVYFIPNCILRTFTTLQLFFPQRWKGVYYNLSCFPINLQEHNHQQHICKNIYTMFFANRREMKFVSFNSMLKFILIEHFSYRNNYISHEFLPKWDNDEYCILSFTLKWMVEVLLSMQHLNFTFSSSFGIRTELKIP